MPSFLQEYMWVIVLAAAWTLPWTAVALWKSARNGEKTWFIVFLLVHTLGLLEIYYIFLRKKSTRQ